MYSALSDFDKVSVIMHGESGSVEFRFLQKYRRNSFCKKMKSRALSNVAHGIKFCTVLRFISVGEYYTSLNVSKPCYCQQ